MQHIHMRIVLVETSHPGNIGAAARAMKTMAIDDLVLVRPQNFPHVEATARASGANDVLQRARVVASVEEAVADAGFVAATTSRDREHNFRVLDVRDAATRAVSELARGPVAILFGAERTGLTNQELALAHVLVRIPANPAYPSLNLAMAVQLVTYELYRARGAHYQAAAAAVPLATGVEMERMYAHLESVLALIEFRDRTQNGTILMTRIRKFLGRAELDANEVNILRGILTSVERRRRRAGDPPATALTSDE